MKSAEYDHQYAECEDRRMAMASLTLSCFFSEMDGLWMSIIAVCSLRSEILDWYLGTAQTAQISIHGRKTCHSVPQWRTLNHVH